MGIPITSDWIIRLQWRHEGLQPAVVLEFLEKDKVTLIFHSIF